MKKMLTLWSAVMLLATTAFAQTTVTINLYDSWGDGWNGGLLTVAGSDYTIDDGSEATFTVDLDDGTYAWAYAPGYYASENSWAVSTADGELFSGQGSDGAQSGTFTLGGSVTPIAEIQYSEDAENDYPSPLDGQEVTVSGVVTAVKYNGINIQDSNDLWSGIWVYSGTGSTDNINIGDIVSVTGTVDEYNLLTEIVCGAEDITVIGTGGSVDILDVPDLEDVHDEALEGMLVFVAGTCTDADISDYGQWDISDDSGTVQIEDHFVDYQPIEGAYYEMIAVVGQSSYDTGYEVAPIDSGAIWETPPCNDNEVFVEMFDSYGDGWNGNVLTIGDESFTLESGGYGEASLCLEDGSYVVTCGGGSWQSEVSWAMYDIDGTELLAGGAPYEGVLQVGETNDILGCTDPNAENYNADATVDDGSCFYAGDSCNIALDAVEGDAGNYATGGEQWFSYTATMNGFLLATTCYEAQAEDTDVDVFSACPEDGGEIIASSDDAFCGDVTGGNNYASEVEIECVAGETYYFFWDDTWGPDEFTWYLYETPPPSSPENLTAAAGVEQVQLEWEGIAPAGDTRGSSQAMTAEIGSNIQEDIDYYNTKKAALVGPERDAHQNAGQVYLKGDRNTRNTDVTIVCDGGSWQSEVSWEIHNSAGEVVASGGAPDSMDATLDDDTYLVYGYDSYGDGWNGNYLSVVGSDGTVYLDWTIDDGASGTSQFTIGEQTDFPNLLFSDIYYDDAEDALMVDVSNDGTLAAGGFYVVYYLTVPTDPECGNDTYEAYSWVAGLGVGETVSTGVGPGILSYVGGYGTYEMGALVDYLCAIDESNEDDNTITANIAIVDPFEGVTWNIYRSEAGAEFASLVSGHTTQDYLDEAVTGDVEYCYYVTQVDSEGAAESDTSNHACATPFAPVELPVPTNLVADADGFDVFVSWTAPDLTGYDPAPYTPSTGDKEDDISTYIAYDPADYAQPRQGGDTFDDAVAIDGLPYNNTGTTNGYTDDYDEACPYTGSTSPDVVYSFTPSSDVVVDVSLCGEGTSYDTKVYVYENEAGSLAGTLGGGAASACNDDECQNSTTNWLSFLPGVVCTAGNTYYIVVDGYGGDAGDYEIDVLDGTPSPLLGYSVYRDGVEVDMIDDETITEWGEFLPTVGTYEYFVTAHYDIYGESEASNTDTATTHEPPAACNPPSNLTAEALGNDVTLNWDAPEGGPGWIGYFNGEYNGGIGTGAAATFECAAKFGPEQLMDYNGMALTKVAFAPNEVAASYKMMIYSVDGDGNITAVDSSEAFDGANLTMGEFHEVELVNPVVIDWTQPLMFGYKVVTTTGYPGGMDTGPAVAGYGDLMNWGGWVSISEDFGLDYNWAIEGFVEFADGGRSLSSFTPVEINTTPTNDNIVARVAETPTQIQTSSTRPMTNYIVYRDGEELETLDVGSTTYEDIDADWGTHEYYVTALYNDSEDCGESEPSNVVAVDLMNNPPLGFSLISPSDNYAIAVDENNLDEQVAFIWTASADPDNDPVTYMLAAMDDQDNYHDTTSTQTGVFLTHGELAADAFEDSVSQITYMWNVAAFDSWDTTWSNDDDRTLVVDILLGIDGEFTPDVFALHNNYPNPFNPITNITYDIPEVADVRLEIYNVTGQRVTTLAQGVHEPGRYRIVWNATNDFGQQLSSGMYIYRIVAGDFVSVKKLILMK